MTTTRIHASALRRALRSYLEQHPGAADGVVGIRLWWLPAPLQAVSDGELRAALDLLVRQDAMRCTTLPDGSELFAALPSAIPASATPPAH